MDYRKKWLTKREVKRRLEKYGRNELPQKQPTSDLKILLEQLKSPLIYVLLFAAIVTFFLKDFTDTAVIMAAVVINTVLGFYQERKAERALEALKEYLHPTATVVRDGKRQEVAIEEIVPGDVVILAAGERVPADGRVVEAHSLTVNEAMLTGESEPVSKEKWEVGSEKLKVEEGSGIDELEKSKDQNIPLQRTEGQSHTSHITYRTSYLYMGTTVIAGRGIMVVEKTGEDTEMGKIATSLQEQEEEKTPLQKKVAQLAQWLAVVVGVIAVTVFIAGVFARRDPLEMFTIAVAVAVAAIPEGLIVALTAILAIGMQRIFKRKALVRKLVAAETLGSVTVVASDKTGTLTKGVMSVSRTEFTDKKEALRAAYFANAQEDPLEIAIMEWLDSLETNFFLVSNSVLRCTPEPPARATRLILVHGSTATSKQADGSRAGLRQVTPAKKLSPSESKDRQNWKKIWEQPFDPEKKYQAVAVQSPRLSPRSKLSLKNPKGSALSSALNIYISGAPEVVLGMCKIGKKERENWEKKIESWASEGLRIVGLAVGATRGSPDIKETGGSRPAPTKNLTWLGLVGIEDPVREEVVETLEKMHKAGIKLKIITGDYLGTAAAVWSKIKAQSKTLKEAYLDEKYVVGADLKDVAHTSIFARVTPQEKLSIVRALQESGEVVAIFGDGMNDAPALKRADIGVVVNEAADTAKETADIVLLDSNFKTVIAAIEEGRGIYDNIKKVMLYLLSDSFSEIVLILLALLAGAFFELPLPLTAAQILWINLVTDGFPNLALTVEPKEEGILKRAPEDPRASLLDNEIKVLIAVISVVTGVASFGIFFWFWRSTGSLELARSVTFAALGIDSLLYVFSVRSLHKPFYDIPLLSNPYLVFAVILGFVIQMVSLYVPFLSRFLETVPLGLGEWGVIIGVSLLVIVLIEGIKYSYNRQLT